MSESLKYPRYGAGLPPGAPGGHCPSCLLQLGLVSGQAPAEPLQAHAGRVRDTLLTIQNTEHEDSGLKLDNFAHNHYEMALSKDFRLRGGSDKQAFRPVR